jgi:hypothetical protein
MFILEHYIPCSPAKSAPKCPYGYYCEMIPVPMPGIGFCIKKSDKTTSLNK